MRALDYAVRQGWTSLWRSRGASTLAVVAIALAMIVLGALLMVTWNIDRVMARWTAAAEFSVYLRDEATSDQRGEIEAVIDASGIALGRDYVSKATALQRFRQEFSDLATIAAGFEDNPFPASVEVRVRSDGDITARADDLLRRLAMMPGVADVRYDREWLTRLRDGLRTVRAAGFTLVALMIAAAAVTVAAVVRLGLDARREEIEIMELVGSPLAFIRGPFVAEGVFQGGLGAALGLLVLAVVYGGVRTWWGADLQAVLDGETIEFLPPVLGLSVVVGGMAIGGAGGFAAARHAG